MSVYVYNEFDIPLPDGSKPWLMCADTEQELHEMANKIGAKIFSDEGTNPFYIVSRTKAKLARSHGAIYGEKAKQAIHISGLIRKDLERNKHG